MLMVTVETVATLMMNRGGGDGGSTSSLGPIEEQRSAPPPRSGRDDSLGSRGLRQETSGGPLRGAYPVCECLASASRLPSHQEFTRRKRPDVQHPVRSRTL